MVPFRRVSDDQAGPNALGILVPPGRRTFVILRPRALAWDLVVLAETPDQPAACSSHSDSATLPSARSRELPLVAPGIHSSAAFRQLDREEAGQVAQALLEALAAWTGGGPGRVEVVAADPAGHWVRVEVGIYPLMACQRIPGQPYRPQIFTAADEAVQAAAALTDVLRPAADAGQEVYFNLRNFGR